MTTLTVGRNGEITVPEDMRARKGLLSDVPVRLIEVTGGILVVPLTSEPMSATLEEELAEWQSLSEDTWAAFAYEEER